jgi:uncharacterized protein (TIGR03118 family)
VGRRIRGLSHQRRTGFNGRGKGLIPRRQARPTAETAQGRWPASRQWAGIKHIEQDAPTRTTKPILFRPPMNVSAPGWHSLAVWSVPAQHFGGNIMTIYKRRASSLLAAASVALLAIQAGAAAAQQFNITNLVSDGSVPAVTVDPSLVNPWGMSFSPTGEFWVSDNGTGVSTLYNGAGLKNSLTVTVPPASGTDVGTPTGQVFNGNSAEFKVTSGGVSGSSVFIFVTEDGTISGWAPNVNSTNAIIAVNNGGEQANYKGLAIGTAGSADFLYAANFFAGDIEMYDANFKLKKTFTDKTMAKGYAPYNVQVLAGTLYVAYAKQDKAKHDSVSGPGFGYVDAFNLKGKFLRRVVSKGALNAPWGLDIAPTGFGSLSGDLLVGNFGDGWINAYDAKKGKYKGPLVDGSGSPIAITGLWGLLTGNGGQGGDTDKVYFTAGLSNETRGLFGSIALIGDKKK